MITNKEKHRNVTYLDDPIKVSRKILNNRFVSVDELDKDFYELSMEKKSITLDIPVVLGFTILQHAKLRMLQFYYDCIDR